MTAENQILPTSDVCLPAVHSIDYRLPIDLRRSGLRVGLREGLLRDHATIICRCMQVSWIKYGVVTAARW